MSQPVGGQGEQEIGEEGEFFSKESDAGEEEAGEERIEEEKPPATPKE